LIYLIFSLFHWLLAITWKYHPNDIKPTTPTTVPFKYLNELNITSS
jgi:hypothetical protein